MRLGTVHAFLNGVNRSKLRLPKNNAHNSLPQKPRKRAESAFDPEDIATDEEAAVSSCQCLIHTSSKWGMQSGYQLNYKTGGDDNA